MANKGKRWTTREKTALMWELIDKISLETIAKLHGRTIRSIKLRSAKLAVDELLRECATKSDARRLRGVLIESMPVLLERYRITKKMFYKTLRGMKTVDVLTKLCLLPPPCEGENTCWM